MANTCASIPAIEGKESKLVYRPIKEHHKNEKKRLDRHVWDKSTINKSSDEDPAVHGIEKMESVIEKVRIVQEIKEKSYYLPD